jgi:hypothetical protein
MCSDDEALSVGNLPTSKRNMFPPSLGHNNDFFVLKTKAATSSEILENMCRTLITSKNITGFKIAPLVNTRFHIFDDCFATEIFSRGSLT